jgi:hypothetical protein
MICGYAVFNGFREAPDMPRCWQMDGGAIGGNWDYRQIIDRKPTGRHHDDGNDPGK